jgi:hypothetical protein
MIKLYLLEFAAKLLGGFSNFHICLVDDIKNQ